jgi:hypothetical protein
MKKRLKKKRLKKTSNRGLLLSLCLQSLSSE